MLPIPDHTGREWVEIPATAVVQQVLLPAAVTESMACPDGRTVQLSVLPLSLFVSTHLSFVEFHNANPRLCDTHHLRRSLSHARLQAAWPSEMEIIN